METAKRARADEIHQLQLKVARMEGQQGTLMQGLALGMFMGKGGATQGMFNSPATGSASGAGAQSMFGNFGAMFQPAFQSEPTD